MGDDVGTVLAGPGREGEKQPADIDTRTARSGSVPGLTMPVAPAHSGSLDRRQVAAHARARTHETDADHSDTGRHGHNSPHCFQRRTIALKRSTAHGERHANGW